MKTVKTVIQYIYNWKEIFLIFPWVLWVLWIEYRLLCYRFVLKERDERE